MTAVLLAGAPELMIGGVHGTNEQRVFAELCTVIEEWIEILEKDNESLAPGLAENRFLGWIESCHAEAHHFEHNDPRIPWLWHESTLSPCPNF